MSSPKVSVIIPTYRGADFLGDAIQSVLDQTYSNFELIVVNDASPDHTLDVVRQFNDPRIKYIQHERNQGVSRTRRTGVMESSGEIIAHLDQDDLFHPEKLRMHVDFLEKHPAVGFTYNSRFELYPTSGAIREILRPSPYLTLADFVLGYPLAPSVWVQRREWAVKDEIWDERTFFRGREIVICGRLYMAGCEFAMIDRVLNYRRYHKNRTIRNLVRACEAERTCQQIIFDDSRCPPDVVALKDLAFSNIYAMWTYFAYVQEEFKIGQGFIRESVRLNASLLDGRPPALVNDLVVASIDDQGTSHEDVLKGIFENLLPELVVLSKYHRWAVVRGYLMQGVRATMWKRPAEAQEYFSRAVSLYAQVDETFLQWLTSHLLSYETEFGTEAACRVIGQVARQMTRLGIRHLDRRLKGHYFANRAFENYRLHDSREVQSSVVRALLNDPAFLKNRGLLSVFLHSIPLLADAGSGQGLAPCENRA